MHKIRCCLTTLTIVCLLSARTDAQGAVGWSPLGNELESRAGASMAADLSGSRVTLFGGASGSTLLDDTWRLSAAGGWELLDLVGRPEPRAHHAMANFSTAAFRGTLLFGGAPVPVVRPSWQFDGTHWIHEGPVAPLGRERHAMVFDSVRGVVLMFGGRTGTGAVLGDTWEWTPPARPGRPGRWAQRAVGGALTARYGHSLAFDAFRGVVLLFGGNGLDETWEFNNAMNRWDRVLTAPANTPPRRTNAAMAYYPPTAQIPTGQIVLFGGVDLTSTLLDDTWVYDSGLPGWRLQAPATRPGSRQDSAMEYAPSLDQLVLVGGTDQAGSAAAGTWTWDGATWRLLEPPGSRNYTPIAFDSVRNQAVLFGGAPGLGVLDDTWLLIGTTWTRTNPATKPLARYGHCMAFDPDRQQTVLFGGATCGGNCPTNETWTWDGTTWTQHFPVTSPPLSYLHQMAWDSTRRRAVFFNGSGCYEWDGLTWTDVTNGGWPTFRPGFAMAYDAQNRQMVAFGGHLGTVANNETWIRNRTVWTQVTPTTSPPPRTYSSMAYDPIRQRCVLYGGVDLPSFAPRLDTWEWDGTNWQQRSPSLNPGPRDGGSLFYHPELERVLLWGGGPRDLWSYGMTHPATFETAGYGCGANGVPILAARTGSRPWIGTSFDLDVTNLPTGGVSVLALGVSDGRWGLTPLPLALDFLAMPDCALFVSPDVQTFVPIFGGSATLSLPLPNDMALVGATLYLQAFTPDPLANPFGLSWSNYGRARVGTPN